jgi:two-component system, OmpR family, KDP operon response regulator KdpE
MIPRLFVLVVDPDPIQRRMLSVTLRRHDFQAVEAARAADALIKVRSRIPDAALLDLEVPDMDGQTLLTELHAYGFPILVVSGNGDERRVVDALDGGANDYITKPYRENELMARLRSALRRQGMSVGHRQVIAGDLRLDITERRLFIGSKEIPLTGREYQLIRILASEAGRVVTHQQLLSQVWSPSHAEDVQYLRVFVRQLRAKVEVDPKHPRRILTALGVGYRLVPVPAERPA